MPESVQDSLHDALHAKVAALHLAAGGSEIPVLKRKLPAVAEGIDQAPAIFCVPSDRPTRDEPWDSGGVWGRRRREYLFPVVFVTPSNGDNANNMPEIGEWRQKVARAFGRPRSVPVAGLYASEVEPGAVIDRAAHPPGYDYSGMAVRFVCIEEASEDEAP